MKMVESIFCTQEYIFYNLLYKKYVLYTQLKSVHTAQMEPVQISLMQFGNVHTVLYLELN